MKCSWLIGLMSVIPVSIAGMVRFSLSVILKWWDSKVGLRASRALISDHSGLLDSNSSPLTMLISLDNADDVCTANLFSFNLCINIIFMLNDLLQYYARYPSAKKQKNQKKTL